MYLILDESKSLLCLYLTFVTVLILSLTALIFFIIGSKIFSFETDFILCNCDLNSGILKIYM